MNIKIITIILATLLLAGCQKLDSTNGREFQSGLQNAAETPSSVSNFSDFVPEDRVTSAGPASEGTKVLFGRLIPIADKERKTVVGWRIIGELYNDSQQLFDNGQIMIGIVDRVLLAEPVQPGGFLPIVAGERMVYDALIEDPSVGGGENITVGVRKVDTANPYIIIGVENIKFNRSVILSEELASRRSGSSTSEESSASAVPAPAPKFTVSGTIRNTTGKSVTGLMVRFWVVSGEEVIAVGTWQAAQDVLAPGQTRDFEAEITALTDVDQEKLENDEVGLLAVGAGRPL